MERKHLIKIILTALFAALIAVGAFIRIPLPPVPITLQTLFALIAGLVLPLPLALASLLIYLFLGAAGLPIFTTGGGLAALTGPTGGYLIGLIPALIIESLVARKNTFGLNILATFLGNVAIYICGLWWLSHSRSLTLGATLAGGLYPFLVGDIIKMIVASLVSIKARERITAMLSADDEDE